MNRLEPNGPQTVASGGATGERQFRALVENAFDAVTVIRPDGVIIYENLNAVRTLGWNPAVEYGRAANHIHPEDQAAVLRLFEELRRTPGMAVTDARLRVQHIDGGYRWVEASARNMIADPAVGGILIQWHDVTDRKRAEDAFADNEMRYRLLTDAMDDFVSLHHRDGRLLYLSPSFHRATGYTTEDLRQADFRSRIHPDDLALVESARAANLAGERTRIEYRCRRKDGSYLWLELRATPIRGSAGAVEQILCCSRDIHSRKRIEEEFRESEERFRAFMDHNPFLAFIKDADGRYLYGNELWLKQFDRPRAEVLGRNHDELWPPAVAERFRESDRAVLRGETVFEDGEEVLGPNGTVRWFTKVKFPLRGPEGATMIGGIAYEITERRLAEESLRRAHAELEDRVRARTADLRRVNDLLQEEISERRRAEERLQELQDELAHVTRLSTMGEMATGLAHELNQPLTAISNYAAACARSLRNGAAEPDRLLHGLDQIAAQAQRAGEVIRRIRGFVARRDPQRQLVAVERLIRESLQLIDYDLRAGKFQVDVQIAESLPQVPADRIQVEQVMLNLIRNAIEAMADTPAPDRRLAICAYRENGFVRVTVGDRGAGIDPRIAEHLFQPFHTTKPRGMGMGLAISRTVVEAHGGIMGCETNPHGGSRFWFTLPIAPTTH